MQQGAKNLKMAAEELNINYSTAKTILQTFKCQKRFAKKPKRSLTSLRSRKREGYLRRTLLPRVMPDIFLNIFADELRPEKCADLADSLQAGGRKHLKLSFAATPTPTPTPMSRAPLALPVPMTSPGPRGSAGMVRSPLEEKVVQSEFVEPGPRAGQVSRGTDVPWELPFAVETKDAFYIYSIDGPEAPFKHKVDYTTPMQIRRRHKRTTSELAPLPLLPPLELPSTELSDVKGSANVSLPNESPLCCPFDFSLYKAAIADVFLYGYLRSLK
jgi:hypothetical protein